MRSFNFDVVVVGGGTAGCAAAVAAARAGSAVALVEKSGFFGGTMTGVSLGSLCGFYDSGGTSAAELLVGGFPMEVVHRLRAAGGAPPEPAQLLQTHTIPYDTFTLKRVLDDLLSEAGVTLFCHTWVSAAFKEGNEVEGVAVQTPEGPARMQAATVIDASGDGVVVAAAKAGHEMRPDVQNATAMFRFGGVDTNCASQISRPQLRQALEQAVADGYELPRTAGGMFSVRQGVMHVNVTRVQAGSPLLDARELAAMEITGRRQVAVYEEAFRKYVPGFADAFVLDCGTSIGVRESRRLVGKHQLTADEVRSGAQFEDAIVRCAWPIEVHSEGHSTKWEWLPSGQYYEIPLRCLLPREVGRLVVAGRCLSAEPEAHASARVSAQCMAMGEATGILASISVDTNREMTIVPAHEVRSKLTEFGAVL